MSALLLGVLLASAMPVAAPASPSDFEWQWTLDAGAHRGGVYRITLDEAVYRHVTRADLRDLAAFDADGVEVPLGPVPWRPSGERGEVANRDDDSSFVYAVKWFPVPRERPGVTGDSLELHIERDAAGNLRRLDTAIAGDAAARDGGDILLDLGRPSLDVVAIDVRLDVPADQSLYARVDLLRSDDLRHFALIDGGQSLAVLRQGGRVLERLRLQVPPTRGPYLLIRRTDADAALPVTAVDARLRPPPTDTRAAQLRTVAAASRATATEAGVFDFRSPGPIPVERLTLTLAGTNAVADVVIESRDGDGDDAWTLRARDTAFHVDTGRGGAGSLPIDIGIVRDRQWRVRTSPPQARAPTLELGYRADQFVLMTQGEPPHRVMAGSARASRANFPLQAMLDTLRGRFGDDWNPPIATLADGASAAGDAALAPVTPPVPWRQWLLWAVLVAGSIAVIAMVLRLLRAPDAAPPE